MDWCAVSKNDAMRPYFFKNESMMRETYQRLLPYYTFLNLGEYSENAVSNSMVSLFVSPFLCVTI